MATISTSQIVDEHHVSDMKQRQDTVFSDVENIEGLLTKMLDAEVSTWRGDDFLSLRTCNSSALNQVWRETVSQWCYDVADHMNESRSVVYVAMNIFDRFCLALYDHEQISMDERNYEFASMTAIFLAVRVAGSGKLRIVDLIQMGRDTMSSADILTTGQRMLNILTWGQRLITPADFLNVFLGQLPDSIGESTKLSILDAASYLVELSVCDVYFSRFCASRIAFAALVHAARSTGHLTEPVISQFCRRINTRLRIGDNSDELDSVIQRLTFVSQRVGSGQREPTPNYVSDDEDDSKCTAHC